MRTLPEFLTPKQCAGVLSVSEKTIYALLNDGRLPSHRVGNRWRVSRDDFRSYVESTRYAPALNAGARAYVPEDRPLPRDGSGPQF